MNSNNQFLNAPYTSDAAGNMNHDASHGYTYDAENHLYQVDGSAGYCYTGSGTAATACYVYDADGKRVENRQGSSRSDYYYDFAGHATALWLNDPSYNGWDAYWAYLGDQMLAQYSNSTTFFAIADHLGSTRLLTAYPTPTIAECDDYYPFGELISCGGTSTTQFKFTGKERDTESNLDNFGARYDSSAQGRFMSPDPIGDAVADPANPQSWNEYSYVTNNPLSMIDPTGTNECFVPPPPPPPPDNGHAGTGPNPNPNPPTNEQDCRKANGTWVISDQRVYAKDRIDYYAPVITSPQWQSVTTPKSLLPLANLKSPQSQSQKSGCSTPAQRQQQDNQAVQNGVDTFKTDVTWGEGGAAVLGCIGGGALDAETGVVPGCLAGGLAAAQAGVGPVFTTAMAHGLYEVWKPAVKTWFRDVVNGCHN